VLFFGLWPGNPVELCVRDKREKERGMQSYFGKDSYSTDRKVLVAGFGTAALLIVLFILLMSWISERVHLMDFCLSRFSR
jgi:hypothetical protein